MSPTDKGAKELRQPNKVYPAGAAILRDLLAAEARGRLGLTIRGGGPAAAARRLESQNLIELVQQVAVLTVKGRRWAQLSEGGASR